jgi:outer membrane protein assembly factor BamE (lipoprotein component of BamABCDE complex)
MKILRILAIFLFASAILLSGCHRKKRLVDFDSDRWIEDRQGCNAERILMKDELLKVKFKLRGKSTSEISDILGKPDAQELYQRNQKYYIYYMEPGPACEGSDNTAPLCLYIRFSAVGIASEITLRDI